MKITDSVMLGDARVSEAGYLEANARTARVGVQQYLGSEVGKPELAVVNVYRDESEVFKKAALNTFSKIPVTNDHPPVAVTAENWREFAVGTTGDEVLRDGEYLKIGLKITDAAAVKAVREGKRELSVGYETTLVWEDGIAPDGTKYQARQTAIKANHVAIVSAGRAGKEVRIGDASKWGASPVTPADGKEPDMPDNLRKVLVDGLQVETTDAGAQAIDKLQKALADSAANVTKIQDDHAKALAAKDEEIGKLKADLKTAQDAAKIDIDKLVADRAALVETVKAIDAKIETAGKSDADLRKAAVAAKLGDDMVKDASEAEILGMFKAVAKDAKADPVADAIRTGIKPTVTDARAQAEKALADSVTDLNAWRYQKEA